MKRYLTWIAVAWLMLALAWLADAQNGQPYRQAAETIAYMEHCNRRKIEDMCLLAIRYDRQ